MEMLNVEFLWGRNVKLKKVIVVRDAVQLSNAQRF